MIIDQLVFLFAPFFLVYSQIIVLQRNVKRNRDCCICRREITNKEELILCPYCQTVYHGTHLFSWLNIKNKCPICKARIENELIPFNIDIIAQESLNSRNFSYAYSNSFKMRYKSKVLPSSAGRDYFVLECHLCGNILDLSIYNFCPVCGSRISWLYNFETKIKNLRARTSFETNELRKMKLSRNRGYKDRKTNSRKIERQKEKNREFFIKKMQERELEELQDQRHLLNQEYLRKHQVELRDKQQFPSLMEELEKNKESLNKTNFHKLKNILKVMVKKLLHKSIYY